jgi:putative FmdB family regulatory protein
MPFYEYECASCKFYTEVMQRISDAPLKKCPSCGKSTMKKLISAPVFRLKGGGWYETDFKSGNEAKRNLAGEASEGSDSKARDTAPAADAKGTDSKSEAKPAEKASSGDSGSASRSASKTSAAKPAKAAAKPAPKAPARKPAPKPKPKAKASKRRGR